MGKDFIADLLDALQRVLTPDAALLREVLIVSGMPEPTENLRYLGFNRQIVDDEKRRLEFSAVAVINNRRADQWRLDGYQKKISQIVFSTRWTRNPLDLFLNAIRCDPETTALIGSAPGRYSLLGILEIEETVGAGLTRKRVRSVRPVIAIPGIGPQKTARIAAFEDANEIRKTKVPVIPLYRKAVR
jgi:hypothetical protein